MSDDTPTTLVPCPRCGGTGEVTQETLDALQAAGVDENIQETGQCTFCDGDGTVASVIAEVVSPYKFRQLRTGFTVTDEDSFRGYLDQITEAPVETLHGLGGWACASLIWAGVEGGLSPETIKRESERALHYFTPKSFGVALAGWTVSGAIPWERAVMDYTFPNTETRFERPAALAEFDAEVVFFAFLNASAGKLSSDRATAALEFFRHSPDTFQETEAATYVLGGLANVMVNADESIFMGHLDDFLESLSDLPDLSRWYCEWTMSNLSAPNRAIFAMKLWSRSRGGNCAEHILRQLTAVVQIDAFDEVYDRIWAWLESQQDVFEQGEICVQIARGLHGEYTTEKHVRRLLSIIAGFKNNEAWDTCTAGFVNTLGIHGDKDWAPALLATLLEDHIFKFTTPYARANCIGYTLKSLGQKTHLEWAFPSTFSLLEAYGRFNGPKFGLAVESALGGVLKFWRHDRFNELLKTWCDLHVSEEHGVDWVYGLRHQLDDFHAGFEQHLSTILERVIEGVQTFEEHGRADAANLLFSLLHFIPSGELFQWLHKELWSLVDSLRPECPGKPRLLRIICDLSEDKIPGGASHYLDEIAAAVARLPACPSNRAKFSEVGSIIRTLNPNLYRKHADALHTPRAVRIILELLCDIATWWEGDEEEAKGFKHVQAFAVGSLQALRTEMPSLAPADYTRYRGHFEGLLTTEISCCNYGSPVDDSEVPAISLRPRSEALQLLFTMLCTTGDTPFRDAELTAHLAFIETHSDHEERLALLSALAASLGQSAEHDWADAWLDRLLELEVEQEADTSALRVAITLAYLRRGELDRAETSVGLISNIVHRDKCLKSMAEALAADHPVRAVRLASRMAQAHIRLDTLEALGLSAELTLTAEVYGQLCGALVETPNRLTTVVEHCVARMPELVDVPPTVAETDSEILSERERQLIERTRVETGAAWRAAVSAVMPEHLAEVVQHVEDSDP